MPIMETSIPPPSPPPQKRTLLEVVRERIRLRHLSYYTERHYLGWIRRFVAFNKIRKASDIEPQHVEAFLTYLAIERQVSPATQNQALNALVFLFK